MPQRVRYQALESSPCPPDLINGLMQIIIQTRGNKRGTRVPRAWRCTLHPPRGCPPSPPPPPLPPLSDRKQWISRAPFLQEDPWQCIRYDPHTLGQGHVRTWKKGFRWAWKPSKRRGRCPPLPLSLPLSLILFFFPSVVADHPCRRL